jgi:hypothetical protein
MLVIPDMLEAKMEVTANLSHIKQLGMVEVEAVSKSKAGIVQKV